MRASTCSGRREPISRPSTSARTPRPTDSRSAGRCPAAAEWSPSRVSCSTPTPERRQPSARPFNQLVLAAPEGSARRYAKIHPFTFGREHEHYAAGKDFLTVDIQGTRCTFFVCYDLRFADEFWALAERTDCYVL